METRNHHDHGFRILLPMNSHGRGQRAPSYLVRLYDGNDDHRSNEMNKDNGDGDAPGFSSERDIDYSHP